MIETVGLSKVFGDLRAVDDLSLALAPGQVLALLGPNGAGKTTTVRMLASILKPTSGYARVAGYDTVRDAGEVRRRVGVLTEAPGLYSRMSGWEYLEYFAALYRLPRTERKPRISRLAEQFRIVDALPRRLGEYSKGMRQKIALMRTLLHDPPVLLLDEPTSAMDPESARLVRDAILQMSAQARHTTIVCTHNLPEAEELSDRIAIISHGRIVVQGTAAELKSRLLGPPVMELRVRAGSVDLRDGVLSLVKQFVTVEGVGDGWVHYRTSDPAVVNPILLGALAEARVPVVTLSELPQSLESVYLQVIEEEGIRGSTG
ncbi:MAG: ABC transporter ATP-binding protein [Chloroflexi bacterium]|nr:ABC transporter ATP-binding protein [Chloroflexota bacterium]